jgi:Flp pilus assembly protein TadD
VETAPNHRPGIQPAFLAGLALALAVAAVFAAAVRAPFVFDDIHALVLNPHLARLWPPDASLWALDQSPLAGRPVVAFSFAIDYALGELSPYGYHVVNIALHALSACLIFALLRRVLGGLAPAFVAALLWALHPLQTEAVTYVVQRTELLSATWLLACLLSALRGMRAGSSMLQAGEPASQAGAPASRRAGWFALSVLCCVLGMASKESVVVAPVLVLLFDRQFGAGTFREALRRHRGLYIGLASSWLVLAALMWGAPRGDSVGLSLGVSSWTWALTQAEVITHYLALALWPSPLAVSYGWPLADGLTQVWPSALLVVGLLALTVVGLVRRNPWALAGAWFFLLLAPTSSVVPIVTEVVAERRMYLPLLAVVVTFVVLARGLLRRRLHSPRAPAASAATILSLGVALLAAWGTTQRLDVWRTTELLWRDTVTVRPDNPMAHFMLANALKAERRFDEALVAYESSLALKPDDLKTLVNMGNCQQAQHDFEGAERTQRRAVALAPDAAAMHLNLALTLLLTDRALEAVPSLERCVELEPEQVDHRCNLALTLIELHIRLDDAREQLETALALDPDDPRALALLEQLRAAEQTALSPSLVPGRGPGSRSPRRCAGADPRRA